MKWWRGHIISMGCTRTGNLCIHFEAVASSRRGWHEFDFNSLTLNLSLSIPLTGSMVHTILMQYLESIRHKLMSQLCPFKSCVTSGKSQGPSGLPVFYWLISDFRPIGKVMERIVFYFPRRKLDGNLKTGDTEGKMWRGGQNLDSKSDSTSF